MRSSGRGAGRKGARRVGAGWARARRGALALLLAALFALVASAASAGVASAHALLVRSDPAVSSVAQTPPSRVRMWFSEDLNALASKAVVVDTTNRKVDLGDSHVSTSNPREMDVGLPLLPAGTYVVVWDTTSAEDGHNVRGSFYFQIARPDGTVPPVPATLPTGQGLGVGGGGSAVGNSGALDSQIIAQAVTTWLTLLLLTFWTGGVLWEALVAPRATDDAAARRFRSLGSTALSLLLVANVGVVLAQSAEVAGEWSGAISPRLLNAILFNSRFGTFWWMRELVALAALALTLVAERNGWNPWRSAPTPASTDAPVADEPAPERDTPPDWRREAIQAARGILRLPQEVAQGAARRSWLGWAELALALALLAAFALSGHAAAVQTSELPYALAVDLLHLLFEAIWVGGLFYLSLVFIPALRERDERERARALTRTLPHFSALALLSVVVLAATGSLNTTIHLTSAQQFLTTTYGRTLAVKIEVFLLMIAISAYHAFFLRPRLSLALAEQRRAEAASPVEAAPVEAPAVERSAELVGSATGASATAREGQRRAARAAQDAAKPPDATHDPTDDARAEVADDERGASAPVSHVRDLTERLEDWLGREALLGVGVLLAVALLAIFAGSLAPVSSAAAPKTSGPFVQTHTVQGDAITLKVTPATFGTNTFFVTVRDAQGKPVDGASVLIQTDHTEMDMGVTNAQLKAIGPTAPGSYSGQSDFTMAGHYKVTVKVLLPGARDFIQTDFIVLASY